MKRPALSAMRSFEIIELFASFPQRRFSFSEILKATKINVSSCHAILSVMTDKGYLIRSEADKAYQLGPSLIAAGKVAARGMPLVARAEREAMRLRDAFDCPVMLCAVVGEELLAVLSLSDSSGQDTQLRGGERLPLVAPLGVPFLSWASDERIAEWLDRRDAPLEPGLRARLMADVALTRAKGYHVALRTAPRATIGSLMAEMARSSVALEDYRAKLSRLIYSFDEQMVNPIEFEPDALYDVQMIVAPVFDQTGALAFNIGAGSFPRPLTGATVVAHAERLTRGCLAIMRDDRAAGA